MYVAHFHDAFAYLYADPIGPVTVHKQEASMFVLNIFSTTYCIIYNVYLYFSCIVFTSCLIYISTKYFQSKFLQQSFLQKIVYNFFPLSYQSKDEFLQFSLSSYTFFFRIFALHIFSFSIALYPPSSTAIFCQSRKLGTRAFSFVPALGPPINKFCGSNIICKTTQNFMVKH